MLTKNIKSFVLLRLNKKIFDVFPFWPFVNCTGLTIVIYKPYLRWLPLNPPRGTLYDY
jgi:hypothetical protein